MAAYIVQRLIDDLPIFLIDAPLEVFQEIEEILVQSHGPVELAYM